MNFFKRHLNLIIPTMIVVFCIAGLLATCAVTSSRAADNKVQFNFENTTDVTKIMHLKKMDQPCYIDPFGFKRCYYTRMMAEMRPDDYTRSNSHKVEKNVGDRFCIDWSNLSSNQDTFEAEFCVIVEDDMMEIQTTPDSIEIERSP